ncbi:hypothetical protein SEVIR_2G396700v4 [Setaria viridis]|uniref:Phorbol-ester/DAG-type domain-containing protein n=1 Tax=Setaria viridis TaxID=4556 RepID=A0A4U6W096_SETVI|nr:uncharacterized protein LOC117844472 [Setaria viridis]TKW35771.1 hypothetical protein SEVIR_2G396700v2 [Setaria viridis]
MASIRHFADPHHPLLETQYSHDQTGRCSICLLKLAGHRGYGCYFCNIHLHGACAGYFEETISFFAHQSHALKLSRSSPGRVCDICRGDCPEGSFVYRCFGCRFDAHPLCAMLPERVGNPFHPEHELCMVSSESPGSCSACHHPLPKWRYTCSSFELHVGCAIDPPPTAAGGQGSNGHAAAFKGSYAYGGAQGSHGAAGQHSLGGPAGQGWWYPYHGPVTPGYYHVIQGGYGYGHPVQQGSSYASFMPGAGHGATGSSGQSTPHHPGGLMSAIARFLLRVAINATVNEFASQLVFGG